MMAAKAKVLLCKAGKTLKKLKQGKKILFNELRLIYGNLLMYYVKKKKNSSHIKSKQMLQGFS